MEVPDGLKRKILLHRNNYKSSEFDWEKKKWLLKRKKNISVYNHWGSASSIFSWRDHKDKNWRLRDIMIEDIIEKHNDNQY